MTTECIQSSFEFHHLGRREVTARFDGGDITTDAGGLLLRQVDRRCRIVSRFAQCFTDHRKADQIEHTLESLIAQRVYALALGYEDLNDHDQLRSDPMMALLAGKQNPKGEDRRRASDRGKACAGKSTLNRLELTGVEVKPEEKYKKIVMREAAIDDLLVDIFLEAHPEAPAQIVLDLDDTDDPVHGNQENRFFHGYYREYCYLPLYIFCGEHLLCARLRPSNLDSAAGALEEVQRIVTRIRLLWPEVRIVLRGDSGFCRDCIMSWCEASNVGFVFGLAKNKRLNRIVGGELHRAQREFERTGKAARVFADFRYRTKKSWSAERRVVGTAEHLEKGANPRFIVSSVPVGEIDARALYEDFYCARGEMENRIKEQQLALFADRTSTAVMRSNQLRLYFSSIAYCLMQALRRLGLKGTEMEQAQCGTIRLRLLKIGAQIRISVRKVWISMSSGFTMAAVFARVHQNLLPQLR
ncbi:MAG TPA: IS1380 family transposase [Candidatus Binatia bacterium]|nr:IS1380 family transposase [Candidatus Binatia bacterium]